jgi:uncharacterized protein (DUF2236 family)
MQVAHPSVAAGVAQHSGFPADAYGRLERTMSAMMNVSFGDTERASRSLASIDAVHGRVVGRRPDGRAYRARDLELLLWVHATLVDSALETYERFVGPLDERWRDAYVGEMGRVVEGLGAPATSVPATAAALRSSMDRTMGQLAVGEVALRLAGSIVRPPMPAALRPAKDVLQLLTTGLLPPDLRAAYRLPWGPLRRRAFEAIAGCVRASVAVAPSPLHRLPFARAAERRAAAPP